VPDYALGARGHHLTTRRRATLRAAEQLTHGKWTRHTEGGSDSDVESTGERTWHTGQHKLECVTQADLYFNTVRLCQDDCLLPPEPLVPQTSKTQKTLSQRAKLRNSLLGCCWCNLARTHCRARAAPARSPESPAKLCEHVAGSSRGSTFGREDLGHLLAQPRASPSAEQQLVL
jgi:hypothetical protein